MSKYTTELRFILEDAAGYDASQGYATIPEIIEKARTKIFDFDFPIFDENYRATLETKILKHFYTREIGAETVALWKFWLDTRMNEIMPFYNQLYNSELIKFNPLYDTDITTDHRSDFSSQTDGESNGEILRKGSGTKDRTEKETTDIDKTSETSNEQGTTDTVTGTESGSGTSSTTGSAQNQTDAWKYYSDTPQGGINGLETLTYLTNATHDTGESSDETQSDTETSDSRTKSETKTGTITGSGDSAENTDILRELTAHEASDDTETTTSKDTNTGTIKNLEQYLEHITGKRSGLSYSKMLMEFRETFLNIDMDIIHALDDLFLNLW